MNGLLPQLAHWAHELSSLPLAADHAARLAFVDTLACIHAGQDEAQVRMILSALRRDGLSGRSRSAVSRLRLPTDMAALVNGTAAHALDYDDYEAAASTHPSAVLVPAILALCESRDLTLDQALRAYIAGYEAICRVGEALGYGHYERGWHSTATVGSIGAALASAKLIGLSVEACTSALSIGATQSAGLKAQFGTDVKAVHPGLAARNGVAAALFAEAGLSASPGAMEGPFGFVAIYGSEGAPGSDFAKDRIGDQPAILNYPPMLKPWPSCAYTHRPIAAALALAARPGFDHMQITGIDLHMPAPYHQVCAITGPKTEIETRFSVSHCVAIALLDGRLGLDGFLDASLARSDVRSLAARITVHPYALRPGLGDMSPDAPDRLILHFQNGQEWEETVAHAPGSPAAPMSPAAVLGKFTNPRLRRRAAKLLTASPETPFRWSRFNP